MAEALDHPSMWAWEPLRPEALTGLLDGFARPWWVCGGWALDLFLNRETRRHDDIDVAVLRDDQHVLFRHLQDWDLRYATTEHTLERWDGRRLDLPVHGIWARRSVDPEAAWTCEFLLNEHVGSNWAFRRNEAVTRAVEEIGDTRNGVPFLRPEIVLLYKAAERSPKNNSDLAEVRSHLSGQAATWLLEALTTWDPSHPWITALRDR